MSWTTRTYVAQRVEPVYQSVYARKHSSLKYTRPRVDIGPGHIRLPLRLGQWKIAASGTGDREGQDKEAAGSEGGTKSISDESDEGSSLLQLTLEDRERLRAQAESEKRQLEEAEAMRVAQSLYQMGRLAYEQGAYKNAVSVLEESLETLDKNTVEGGEAQLWLALSYEACQQNEPALEMYRKLEVGHPSPQIRSQARDLRYIFEAPKLKISDKERVKIPDLAETFDDKYGANKPVVRRTGKKKIELTLEERVMRDWRPKVYVPNKYILVASTVVTLGLAYYSAVYAR
eukprot:CAMPEP_0114245490 /NCGR_PEP_ID=MMETSP0058-20121206/11926_1 /TAXON_ID=36894 /ORGANISM="Pyramimonas parkeae, CCMP726" /LENGTH=287 /DNA_ID=CAMNT_0001358551 /DNA_START=210 /DNA_END=1073 /DNA_ORIENTATION=+